MVLNSRNQWAFCPRLSYTGHICNIHDDRQKEPDLAVNPVTDKPRCCLGHQCFFHYLLGFMLHLDHLFISDLRIRVIQLCAYLTCVTLFSTQGSPLHSGSVEVDYMIRDTLKEEVRATCVTQIHQHRATPVNVQTYLCFRR